jgi:hypothetical protein
MVAGQLDANAGVEALGAEALERVLWNRLGAGPQARVRQPPDELFDPLLVAVPLSLGHRVCRGPLPGAGMSDTECIPYRFHGLNARQGTCRYR